jgi:hypothetical protein
MPEYNGGQLDPGITAEYDLASLMANKTGFLSDDQTHQMKLFGSYTFNFGPRFNVVTSGAYTGISGFPVNALASEGVAGYGSGMSFIVPRGQAGRTPWVHTFDAGVGLGYTVRAPYAISARVDFFNIFNSETVQEVDSNYTFDDAMPISQLDCEGRDSASAGNPINAIQADCPAIRYLKTLDGRPVTVNPNYGKAASTTTAFQAPFSARFSLALSF